MATEYLCEFCKGPFPSDDAPPVRCPKCRGIASPVLSPERRAELEFREIVKPTRARLQSKGENLTPRQARKLN